MRMPPEVYVAGHARQQAWLDHHGLVVIVGHVVRQEVVDTLGLTVVLAFLRDVIRRDMERSGSPF